MNFSRTFDLQIVNTIMLGEDYLQICETPSLFWRLFCIHTHSFAELEQEPLPGFRIELHNEQLCCSGSDLQALMAVVEKVRKRLFNPMPLSSLPDSHSPEYPLEESENQLIRLYMGRWLGYCDFLANRIFRQQNMVQEVAPLLEEEMQ